MQVERSVASEGKFYRLPPDKKNTVIVICSMELEEVVFKKLEELLGNLDPKFRSCKRMQNLKIDFSIKKSVLEVDLKSKEGFHEFSSLAF